MLYLAYGQNPGSLLGSVTLNVNVNALLGSATSPYQQPVCASTTGQQGQTYGSGSPYGNQYFVIQSMTMSGFANVQYYNQTVQAPVQVYLLGQNCQSYGGYVDLYSVLSRAASARWSSVGKNNLPTSNTKAWLVILLIAQVWTCSVVTKTSSRSTSRPAKKAT
ncbi:MAG: hypothetical protein R3B54_17450 [Bdellovibrionota bacterium]